MKRRLRPHHRFAVRRAGVARLGQQFRFLTTAATSASAGDPADSARAIDAVYKRIQRLRPATAARMHPYEINRLTDQSFAFTAEVGLMNLDLQRPAVLDHRRDLRDRFVAQLAARWGSAIDELRILHEVAWEAGSTFHAHPAAPTAKHEPLARLYARGLALTAEIVCLLEHGFASGAMARWRTLHETAVVAAVLARGDEAQARRYLEHEVISRWRQTKEYDLRAEDLGFSPLDEADVSRIRRLRDAAVAQHGRPFSDEYGWANTADNQERITFRDLETLAGHGYLRPYYQMASQPVHAGARGIVWDIGAVDERVLVTGPSDRGLVDPAQLTGFSLLGLTRTHVLSSRAADLRWVVYVDALEVLARRVRDSFHRAAVAAECEPGSVGLVSASVPGSPSLLRWPVFEPEEYEELLLRAMRLARRQRGPRRRRTLRRRRRSAVGARRANSRRSTAS